MNAPTESTVQIGDGMELEVKYVGQINAKSSSLGKTYPANFDGVLYIPRLKFNLLSVSKIRKKGFKVSFTDDKECSGICKVIDHKSNEFVMP